MLQVQGLSRRFGGVYALQDVSLEVAPGELRGVIGPNGAGKSTLLKILLGEEELDAGEVFRHPNLRLGYLRQHDPFLPGETRHTMTLTPKNG